jgi:hypothetical protein
MNYFIHVLVEDNSREIIQSACRSIGSVKDNEFDVRFNPDLFQPHVILNQTVLAKTRFHCIVYIIDLFF